MKFSHALGGSSVAQSPTALNERTVNFYPEIIKMPGGKSQIQLYPTPGVELFMNSPYGPTRGKLTQNGAVYLVQGSHLVRVLETGTIYDFGTMATNANPATLAANGDGGATVLTTSGNHAYALDLNTLIVTDLTITGNATMAAYLDGRYLYLDADTSTFYISDLFSTTFQASQAAQRTVAPDRWNALYVYFDYIVLGGDETTEIWENVENSPFPFAPVPGALYPWGFAAPFSGRQVASSFFFVAKTSNGGPQVVALNGLQPKVVSTTALEVAMASYETVADAIADSYEDLGHTFYVLTFPAADHTWVYDLTTGLWHERGTWTGKEFVALQTFYHVYAFGKHFVGDRVLGHIYEQSSTFADDSNFEPLRRLRRTPSFSVENKRVFFDWFELLLESGLGLSTGQGSNPQVMLRCSNDGGKTWGAELWRSAGAQGAYTTRVRWERLGSARDRQFEIVVSDPIPWRLIDAYVQVTPGTEVAA